MIAQHQRLVDAQIRDSLFDQFGTVRRLDKIVVPVVGSLFSAAGMKLRMPRVHVCALRYGNQPNAPVADRIFTRGGDLYKAYDTTQKIDPNIGVKIGEGFHYLSAWDIKGRYMRFWEMYRTLIIAIFIVGLIAGFISGKVYEARKAKASIELPIVTEIFSTSPALGLFREGTRIHAYVDGRMVVPDAYRETVEGWQVKVGNTWYRGISK
jgi:hypothetical protein